MFLINYLFKLFFIYFIVASNQTFCMAQSNSLSEKIFQLNNFNMSKGITNNSHKNYGLSYNNVLLLNSGHKNIDNNAEIFSPGKSSVIQTFRLTLNYSWLSVFLEPYKINHKDLFNTYPVSGSYHHNNHSGASTIFKEKGLRQSQILIHYKNFGFGYGKVNHWWGPGFHSSIVLSSNSPSQETYSFGTFKEIRFKSFGFYSKIIGMPYKNQNGNQIYFSGIKSQLTFYSNPIISIGINRAYYSGIFPEHYVNDWEMTDALNLVVEPLFGQSKTGLSYTIDGTQGFDDWDEILSVNLKLIFPDDKIELYAEIASDDNRANLTDLRAHWDHTLGYQLGLIKELNFYHKNLLFGFEYTSTRESNTFKSSFFRANPNASNFYSKGLYDFSTYEGRFMGAHSGSSSIDYVMLLGLISNSNSLLLTYNKEKNGIKHKEFPELKDEISLAFVKKIDFRHSVFIKAEYEKINNFRFLNLESSKSNLLFLGYTFHFIR